MICARLLTDTSLANSLRLVSLTACLLEQLLDLQLESAAGYNFRLKDDKPALLNPSTIVELKATHTVITNLWYNNGRCVESHCTGGISDWPACVQTNCGSCQYHHAGGLQLLKDQSLLTPSRYQETSRSRLFMSKMPHHGWTMSNTKLCEGTHCCLTTSFLSTLRLLDTGAPALVRVK